VARDLATAERIIAEELDRYVRWVARRGAAPAVRRLREDLDALMCSQVQRATRGVADEARPVVEDRVRRALGRVAHQVTERLLEAAEAGDDALVEVLAGLYASAATTTGSSNARSGQGASSGATA
jgi:glutamyl-tRNA reductase